MKKSLIVLGISFLVLALSLGTCFFSELRVYASESILFDLDFGSSSVSDASIYNTPISTNDAFKTVEALGGYAYFLKDYNHIEISRDSAQIFSHDQFSVAMNIRRAYPSSYSGDIFMIYSSMNLGVDSAGGLYFDITNSDDDDFSLVSDANNLDDTDWHNVIVTFDSVAGQANMYIDGVRQGQVAVQGSSQPREYWGPTVGSPWSSNFNGFVANLEMRSDIISSAEAQDRYQELMSRVNSSSDNYDAPDYIDDEFLSSIPPVNLTSDFSVSSIAGLNNAIENANDGDVIELASGDYGQLEITDKYFDSYVSLVAAAGARVVFSDIQVRNSSYLLLRGFEVLPDEQKTAVSLSGDHIVFEDSYISFSDSISGWTSQDWLTRTGNAIEFDGVQVLVRNNHLRNISHGVVGDGAYSLVYGNLIENFCKDGMRGLGDYSIFENNTVRNAYKVDDHHDDGFQSWGIGADGQVGTGPVTGIIVRGNTIINNEDPNQVNQSNLQGIGMFDGPFDSWIIENNIVVVNQWHGISVYGGDGTMIKNNTVVDLDDERPGPTWTGFSRHKNGTAPTNALVQNNLVTGLFGTDIDSINFDNNHVISFDQYDEYFVDPANLDFRIRSDAPVTSVGASRDGSYVSSYTGYKDPRYDVDQDGGISTKDALIVLRKHLGLYVSGANWHDAGSTGDANQDGVVNTQDALLILRSALEV